MQTQTIKGIIGIPVMILFAYFSSRLLINNAKKQRGERDEKNKD